MDRRDDLSPAPVPTPHLGQRALSSLASPPPRSIAVDLTRLLPGGVNGGAKLMTLELVARMARLAHDWRFLLLTSAASHAEFEPLERGNVRRICIQGRPLTVGAAAGDSLKSRARSLLRRHELTPLRWLYGRLFRRPKRLRLLADEGIDCLFLPLTAPLYYEPGIPSVAVVYDLQHVTFPQFFSFEDRYFREKYIRDCLRMSQHVVCISDYARQTVLRRHQVPPSQVSTIYIGVAPLARQLSPGVMQSALARWKLTAGDYFLYPANSWPHKNHRRLFEAFALYLANGNRETKLVCCGADTGRHDDLCRALQSLRLEDRVVLTGYLSGDELAALYRAARAIVFPSLYEGFGMPVVEAMSCGKPVACSNTTSLPEIAGDAAILFDPRNAGEIAAAMRRIDDDPALVATLAERGRRRVELLGTPDDMAMAYLGVLERACGQSSRPRRPAAVAASPTAALSR